MRIIEAVIPYSEWDTWMDLKGLSHYSGLSIRSLRAFLIDADNPLPHYRMREPHVITTKAKKRRAVSGKILIRRSEFDRWMQAFQHVPVRPAYPPAQDLSHLVDEVVAEIRR